MEQLPENSTSCFVNGSNSTMKAVELRAGIGGLSAVICGIVVVLILYLKAYKIFIDRLVFYITLSAFLFSVNTALQIVSLVKSKSNEESADTVLCSAVGYLGTITIWLMALFLVVISIHLFLLVAFQVEVSKCEVPIVISIPIISAAVASIPFATGNYGSTVAWCWIESRVKDKSHAGIVEQMVLGYTPEMLVTAFNLFVAVYVAWVVCRQRGARRQHMEAVKETIHLILYPIINELLYIVGIANRIDHYINNPYCHNILWWLSAALTPLIGIVTTLALLFHVLLTEYRRRKRNRQRQRTESETRYTVPPEFPSEVEPLVITGARPQEPETAYSALFITGSTNTQTHPT